MDLKSLLKNCEVDIIQGSLNKSISKIQYDSRKIKDSDLFVCIQGYTVDGHNFIKEAIKNGANSIVISRDIDITEIQKSITIIKCIDSRKLLAHIAMKYYDNPSKKLKLIGITGTNGKTTSTYLIKKALETKNKKVGLIGTIANYIDNKKYNSEHTTPESLDLHKLFAKMVESGCEYCVMEVSSHSIALDRVYGCEFDIAIFTNLTLDHQDFHGSLDSYYSTKKNLFLKSKLSVINIDDPYGMKLFQELKNNNKCVETYSLKNKSDLNCKIVEKNKTWTKFMVKNIILNTNLIGEYNIYNCMTAVAIAKIEDIKIESLVNTFTDIQIPGRFYRLQKKLNLEYEVIIDFAHSPDALEKMLKTTKEITKNRLIAVYGCGGDKDKFKRAELGRVGTENADIVIITTDNPRDEKPEDIIKDITKGINKNNYFIIVDRKIAIKKALSLAKEGDTVVLAGKGHEKIQIKNNKTIEFNEEKIVKAFAKKSKLYEEI